MALTSAKGVAINIQRFMVSRAIASLGLAALFLAGCARIGRLMPPMRRCPRRIASLRVYHRRFEPQWSITSPRSGMGCIHRHVARTWTAPMPWSPPSVTSTASISTRWHTPPTCTAVKFSHRPGIWLSPAQLVNRKPSGRRGAGIDSQLPRALGIRKINATSPATAFHFDQVAKAG